MTNMFPKLLALFVLAGFVLAACGLSGTSLVVSDSQAQGKAEFGVFCANCHGGDGAGSDSAPSIFGHDGEEIRAQVRSPIGSMPSFSPMLLTDGDLDLIVEYALSLGAERQEAQAHLAPGEEEKAHLLAAFEAIDVQNADPDAAINHLQQAMALASGDAAAVYAEMIESIEFGKTDDVHRELEMLLGITE